MKIKEIEGTPEEINEYIKKSANKENDGEIKRNYYSPNKILVEKGLRNLKAGRHYSTTKHEWVAIRDMDAVYIMNVMRKLLDSSDSKTLFEYNEEFKSLAVVLSDKIVEDL